MSTEKPPELEGQAKLAVEHKGGHLQIIAAAGSGKTEVVSQRVADLLRRGESAESIVAFTFTEKAADELKERIRRRVTHFLGEGAGDQLGKLYVGTIHGYCFRLLQMYVPKYETYTPLDSNQLVNLLYREGRRLKLKQFGGGKLFQGVANFLRSVDVVENELLNPEELPLDSFRGVLVEYYAMLDRYRFMSFGTQITRAVEELTNPAVHAKATADVRHLIVDEYQDVNPAQERLIELLAKPKGLADLVVVGDDDQAIYQWRGSAVSNIVTFSGRYPDVTKYELLTNRRSRPAIVGLADAFAQTIPGRLPKQMGASRDADGAAVAFAVGFDDEETEADAIAMDIEALHASGVAYRDVSILVRGRAAYPKILDALDTYKIPYQPGGRTGLFEQPEAGLFGATYAWLADIDWAPGRFIQRSAIGLDDLIADYTDVFDLTHDQSEALRTYLDKWKPLSLETNFNVSLVGDFYALLGLLGVGEWDTTDGNFRNRLGTVGRFTNVLADYESVTRRSRQDEKNLGEQVGGDIGGEWFYKNFALLLVNYANGSYDDFDGEEDLRAEGVALGTVHGAKGLEWPIVFLPSLTNGRFPSSRIGSPQEWLLPTTSFDVARYVGSDADERRLFYVALTRARDWVSLSSHRKVNTQTRKDSPYLTECLAYVQPDPGYPTPSAAKGLEVPDLTVTYSELAAYAECPQSFLLRNELGFMPPIQAELGYGNAVHHVMRVIAEHTQRKGSLPTPREINDLLTSDFYLPFANKAAHKQMRENARKLVFRYVNVEEHRSQLLRTWATERPFELYLPGVVVSGRADVIYDDDGGGHPENLVIVDYKTSTDGAPDPLQLQVYTDAGRREGLTVQGALIHDMTAPDKPFTVDVSDQTIANAERVVIARAEALRQRDFTPTPELAKCRRCDVRAICRAAKLN